MPYHSPISGDIGIHYNCSIASDPLISVKVSQLPSSIRGVLLNNNDINILTGVLHTVWRYVQSPSYSPRSDIRLMREIPWNVIRWGDLLDMGPDAHMYDVNVTEDMESDISLR